MLATVGVVEVVLGLSVVLLLLEVYLRASGTQYDSEAEVLRDSLVFVIALIRSGDRIEDDSTADEVSEEALDIVEDDE